MDQHHPLPHVPESKNASLQEHIGLDEDSSSDFFWGYQVHHQQYGENIPRSSQLKIKRSKLQFVQTPYTRDDRVELLRIFRGLIRNKIIGRHGSKYKTDERDVLDILTDILVKALQHTKEQLMQLHNFSRSSVVEFALTVPTIRGSNASRILQTASQTSARVVEFGIRPQRRQWYHTLCRNQKQLQFMC